MEERASGKNNKKTMLIVIVLAALAAIACVGLYVHSTSPAVRLQRQLDLGNRYLDGMDYAQAIAAFDAAIEIDPMNVDAYKGLISGYSGLEDEDGLFDTYTRFASSLEGDPESELSAMTIDEMCRMTDHAIASGNYDKAEHILVYLSSIDTVKADELQILLNNSMCDSLGHEWADATCSEPRHCLRCGITEGNPLEHIPTVADYWTPSVCEVCGEELAPALTPEFISRGFESMEVGGSYRYVSESSSGEKLIADIKIIKYFTEDKMKLWDGARYSDDNWELQEKEDYEWRILSLSINYSGVKAFSYSYGVWEDGYYTLPTSEIDHYISEDEKGVEHFTIEYLGKEYECEMITDWGDSGFYNGNAYGADIDAYLSIAIHVPKGYYGPLLIIYDSRYSHETIGEGIEVVFDDEFYSQALYFHFD